MQNASSFKRDEFKRNDFTQAVIAKKQSKVVKKYVMTLRSYQLTPRPLG